MNGSAWRGLNDTYLFECVASAQKATGAHRPARAAAVRSVQMIAFFFFVFIGRKLRDLHHNLKHDIVRRVRSGLHHPIGLETRVDKV